MHRHRQTARKCERGKSAFWDIVPERGKSSRKSSLASPRDNLGPDSPGTFDTINPVLGSLESLFMRKRMAQVTGTNASPLGYWFERSPAGLEAGIG